MSKAFNSNFFATIFATATEAWILIDVSGVIQMINPRTSEMFGYEEKELLGKKIEILMPNTARRDHVTLRAEYFINPRKRPHGIGVEVLGLHKDKHTFPVEIGLNYHVYESDTYALAVITDITLRKEKERNLQKSLIEKEQLKSEKIKSELKALKNQINPHYLFNCLSVLNPLIVLDPKKSQQFTTKLAQTYRYILELKDKHTVTVKDELKFIDDYLFLQRVRFEDKFMIRIRVNEKDLLKKIVPLSLQLLLENAFKHNAIYLENKLIIEISSEETGIVISNNLIPKIDLESTSFGIGLENLQKRYSYLSNNKPEFMKNNQSFTAKIPFIS